MDDSVLVSFQVLPRAEGLDIYDVVDRAIAVVQASGVPYEIGAMETTMEGPIDRLLEVAKAAHAAAFKAGARKVVTILKIGDSVDGASIEKNLEK